MQSPWPAIRRRAYRRLQSLYRNRHSCPMADAALYFPYLEIPDSPTLTRVLLYWDSVGVIAPDVELPRHTSELVRAGLADAVHPQLWNLPSLETGFAALLDQALPALRQSTLPGVPRAVRLHQDKGTYELWSMLEDRGLVHHGHGGWLEADPAVAALYMAYLAAALAHHPGLRRELVTDQRGYLEPFLAQPSGLGHSGTIDRMRAVLLRDVLPSPREAVALRDLVAFKETHWDLLGVFRRSVESELLQCARERDPDLRARMLESAAEDLRERTMDLEAKMREARWRPSRGILVAALSALPAAVGLAMGGGLPDAVGLAVPFLVEGVQETSSDKAGTAEALAYAALARHAFSPS